MLLYQIPSNVPTNLKGQVFDARKKLAVNPLYTWESRYGLRDLHDLTTIVLHHDAISKAASKKYSDIEFAQRIAINHINLKKNLPTGDAGFPYHIWIRSGVIYVTNDLEDLTFGVASNNGYTVHICVSGNYVAGDVLDDHDRNALYGAILMVKALVPSINTIKAHKEITATSCPGYDIGKVRKDIADIEASMALNNELDNTNNTAMAQVYAAYTRFSSLYTTATASGPNQAEAQRKIMQIAGMMVDTGILKVQ